ncbi:uncharacterized protein LOC125050243 [Pieris napi]|uniref:uncharacterized protein LOC125050243 n=1 Tax=Pieris napi TaxID=78633 RepID=UPI001FB8B8C7|nr:uncharacterized protein LOC125050243 [Pieris napi]XP_047505910.1 uncharacterized protein LOC125050243 [Pieris napi]XP_047505911.1 uncharacterized protein LOC125050243 [Pieris napi]
MEFELKHKKAMSKEEVNMLLDLIESKPIITIKQTDATTNKSKEEAWSMLTAFFNTRNGGMPRSKEQLKAKWDNLKKAARKRDQDIKLNSEKTDGSRPIFIPPDEVLDKVMHLLKAGRNAGDGSLNVAEDSEGAPENSMDNSTTSIIPNIIWGPKKAKKKKHNSSVDYVRQARDLAIKKYYEKKVEKVNLEIKILMLEYEKKKNEIKPETTNE